MANKIPKRSEVRVEDTWNLSDIFPNDEAWLAEYKELQNAPAKVAAHKGKLGGSAKNLLAWFEEQDELSVRLTKFYGYASCKSDEDTGNGTYQDFRAKAISTIVAISSAAAFATPEIMAIDDEALDGFYAAEPKLETYRRSLYQIRRRKAHILSPAEEKLLAAAGEMANAPEQIGSVLRDADMTYPDVTDGEGNVHTLTDGTLVPLLMSSDRTLRKNTFQTYYKRLGEFRNTVAATLDAQFRQLKFYANARSYGSTIEASLDNTEVPVPVYLNLIEAVHQNLPKMYRYVALRKKIMGVDELHMYDVYPPIIPDADVEISFEEAKKTVLEALAVLCKDYTDLLRQGF